ncbi:MAG TPA: M1 family aminopeptidase [Bacteroidales bacterium]|nr:M1 family aminopeptidase [Bacteroidales bacterium]
MNNLNIVKHLSLLLLLAAITIINESCIHETGGSMPQKGVSKELARERKAVTGDVEYSLNFTIPASVEERIKGENLISISLRQVPQQVVFDFKGSPEDIRQVTMAGKPVKWQFASEHIVLPGKYFSKGPNEVNIDFLAGDMSLNRNADYMYTLFVPDRARTAFPCFDQPDLKAVFRLSLSIPPDWVACANGPVTKSTVKNGFKKMTFAPSEPLPSYLFAFAAGRFQVVSKTEKGRTIRLFHRETDTTLVEKNIPVIFQQVFASLEWLENYTGLPYPFAKYDMVAIPSFQYGGMEHTGATLYRSSRLMLPASATQEEELDRANLIAHETSHMWFGDLVTMKWFNEVWLKEVFANFMAEKITYPWFPGVDFRLKFLMAHYRQAYAIDRTAGANPIEQDLDNLEDAGTVYGPVIYHKAPIVMRKLEKLTGDKAMQSALQSYLQRYSYGNAGWKDLITILDKSTSTDLEQWSHVWVEEAGMPEYNVIDDPTIIRIEQNDPAGSERVWPDIMNVYDNNRNLSLHFICDSLFFRLNKGDHPVLNADGFTYGSIIMENDSSLLRLMNSIYSENSTMPALTRASQWIIIYENLLNAGIKPETVINHIISDLSYEEEPLLINQLLGYAREIYWKFLPTEARQAEEPVLTSKLWFEYKKRNGSVKKDLFRALANMSTSKANLQRLHQIWNEGGDEGLDLSEQERINLGYELALKDSDSYNDIIDRERKRIKNPDRLAAFNYVVPALNPDRDVRQSFVGKLKDPSNREHEAWVLTAIYYLNHPLRQSGMTKNLYQALDMLQEIQQTGDIFFPGNWLDAWLSGHNSEADARQVRLFLNNHPDYPQNLKRKILQSSDKLFRAVRIRELFSTT